LLTPRTKNPVWRRAAIAVILAAIVGATFVGGARMFAKHSQPSETTGLARSERSRYAPTAAEWAGLSVATVSERTFRAEHVTEGKIAVNEDSSTPIFSPYAGRVTKLLVKPSDMVERGQPLFVVEATDTVQD
jgi:membrane fusion protein, heavy metal efflux system